MSFADPKGWQVPIGKYARPWLVGGAVGLLLLAALGSRAEDKDKDTAHKIYDEALVDLKTDEPGLPRVLLIGDSISVYYTLPTRNLLKGRANLHRPPENSATTAFGLEELSKWLGQERWDVIHFNWGLHDLIRHPDGQCTIPLNVYETNLRELVRRLKLTGATLIWASSTPIPGTIKVGTDGRWRSNDDVVAYDHIARKIMEENEIAIDDLYTLALPRLKELQLPGDPHFTFKGSEVLAEQVAGSILDALRQRAKHT